jgi:hypothetical protein
MDPCFSLAASSSMMPTEYLRFHERQVFEAVADSASEAASEIFHSEAVDLLHPPTYHHPHHHAGNGDRKRRPSSTPDGDASSAAATKRPATGLGLISPPLFPHWTAFQGKLAVVPGCPSSSSGENGSNGSGGVGTMKTTSSSSSEIQQTNDDEWKNVQVVSIITCDLILIFKFTD